MTVPDDGEMDAVLAAMLAPPGRQGARAALLAQLRV